jgi:hypothetical protein
MRNRIRAVAVALGLSTVAAAGSLAHGGVAHAANPQCTVIAQVSEVQGPLLSYKVSASSCIFGIVKKLCVELVSVATGTVVSGPKCSSTWSGTSRSFGPYQTGCSVSASYYARGYVVVDGLKYNSDNSGTIVCSSSAPAP